MRLDQRPLVPVVVVPVPVVPEVPLVPDVPLVPVVPDVPLLPLVPMLPLVPLSIVEPVVPELPLVPVPLESVVELPLVPVPLESVVELPLVPLVPLLPCDLALCFFCFLTELLVLLAAWSPVCALLDCMAAGSAVLLVCALALNEVAIAAAAAAPNRAFNSLCIFMFISKCMGL